MNTQREINEYIFYLKCFAFFLLFNFGEFKNPVNGIVTRKVQFPSAPLSDFIEEVAIFYL